MKTVSSYQSSKLIRPAMGALFALALSLSAVQLHAETGEEALMSTLPASFVNQATIPSNVLVTAVSKAVSANKKMAPEIVCAAMPKTDKLATHELIIKAAVAAVGDPSSSIIPKIVASAVKCSSNCGNAVTAAGCKCAEQFTIAAIEALGASPSESMVVAITEAAINALDGRCADGIVRAASSAAPQYASSIADAGAKAGNGAGSTAANGTDGGDEGVVFSPTGRPVPAPFSFSPATSGIVGDVSPVN